MADIAEVIASMGGEGATLLKGQVSAVSTGQLTVTVNGGTFTRVPYLVGSWSPAVNDQVYLLAQAGFGMIALGSPVGGATSVPTPPTPTVTTVDPTTVSNWQIDAANPAGHWVDLTGDMVQSTTSSGVWFYSASALAAITFTVASLQMQLLVESGGPVELVLHDTTGPIGVFAPHADDLTTLVNPLVDTVTLVDLPLGWATALISGTAKGIAAKSASHTAQLFAHGTLTFTSL